MPSLDKSISAGQVIYKKKWKTLLAKKDKFAQHLIANWYSNEVSRIRFLVYLHKLIDEYGDNFPAEGDSWICGFYRALKTQEEWICMRQGRIKSCAE